MQPKIESSMLTLGTLVSHSRYEQRGGFISRICMKLILGNNTLNNSDTVKHKQY